VFAHITSDPVMTEAFKRGEDIHARTARDVFGAKTKKEESDARRVRKDCQLRDPVRDRARSVLLSARSDSCTAKKR